MRRKTLTLKNNIAVRITLTNIIIVVNKELPVRPMYLENKPLNKEPIKGRNIISKIMKNV